MTILVRADLFKLAYSAVSTEETRYYLNGVHVEPHPVKGALLVSTDGHRMICVYDADATCTEQAIVQLPGYALALCTAKKGKGLGIDRQMLDISPADKTAKLIRQKLDRDGLVTATEPRVTSHGVIVEGTFPDWRKVTPQGEMEPISLPAFNPKLMAELGRFGALLMNGYTKGAMYFLRKKGTDDGAPVIVRFSGIDNVFAILMPMRADPVLSLPTFFDAKPEEALAA